jgi:molybdate transport system substrate-binding protein
MSLPLSGALGALLAALAFAAGTAGAANVTVFAAASLKEAMDAQARAFEAQTGDKVVVAYAGSNALARQIEAGAPADLFISADLEWMDYVDQRKLLVPGTRADLLRNALVLVAPAASRVMLKIAPGFALAPALGDGRLALANPDSVPAGKYARSALESLGAWTSVEKRVARAENVRAALAFVAKGEAPLGIVYETDARADPAVRIVDAFPASSHPPIVYPAALVASGKSTSAKALLDFLRSPQAAQTWRKFGFATPG